MKKQTKKVAKKEKKAEIPKRVSPADVFIHLFTTVMLYASAISFLVIAFQLINVNMPDTMDQNTYNYYYLEDAYNLMRGAVAFLLIAFPAYLLAFWRLKKSYQNNPEKLELRIRKWLVYLTLFLTALLIIGNLIALVIGFLHGDLTLRFILKIISVFFVAASIFCYYIFDLKDKYKTMLSAVAIFVSLVAFMAVAVGFFHIGTPATQRLRKFDNQKVQSMEMIKNAIDEYYMSNKKLPSKIDELKTVSYTGFSLIDPQTNEKYIYKNIDSTQYSLCATFNLSNYSWDYAHKYNLPAQENDWSHPSGKYCFQLITAASIKTNALPN